MDQLSQIRDLLDADRHEEALRLCEELIQSSGGRGEVALLTAAALTGLARLQEAETWVQRARSDLGDDEEALRLLARIYRRRGWRVRAQAIERRLSPQPVVPPARPQPTHVPPTEGADQAQPVAPPRPTVPPPARPRPEARDVAPTEDVPAASARSSYPASPSSTLPKLVSTSDTGIPTLEKRESVLSEPITVPEETLVEPTPTVPDPLGLLSAEEAEVARSQGAVRAVVPDPEPPAEEPEDGPSDDVTSEPTLEPRSRTETVRLGPGGLTDEEDPALYVDNYSAQRRRSKVILLLGTLLTVAAVAACIVVYRAWREETRHRTLLTTQRLVDGVEYEGLKEARELIREAIGGSSQPDGTLCARGSQVELYLWMYYTGERAYLHQARELLEKALERDPGGVETRFAEALWEGYLGDVSVTLTAIEELESGSGLRADRIHLLRGVAASATGDHAQAAHHFEEAVSLHSSSLNHLAFARAAERQGALIDAQDQLEGILSNDPGHILAEVDLALLHAGPSTHRGYVDAVEKVREQYNGLVPARVMSRIFAAHAEGYAARNDHRRTEEWYGRALGEDPENPDILLAYGHELRIRGDLTEARGQLSKIVKNQPYSGDALGELGIIAYLQDRPHFLADRLSSFPDGTHRGAAFRLASGLHHLMNDEPDLAAEMIARTPEDLWGGEARLHLGRAQLESGDNEGARETFKAARRLIQQHRGKGDPLVSVADLSIALVDVREKGRASRADVDRALDRHSRYPIVLFHAAQVLEESGSKRRASHLYRKAFERGQDFSLALVGFVRTSEGDSRAEPLARVAADTYLRISPRGPHSAAMKEIAER